MKLMRLTKRFETTWVTHKSHYKLNNTDLATAREQSKQTDCAPLSKQEAMRLIKQNIIEKDGSGTATLLPEEPEDMVSPSVSSKGDATGRR